MSLPIIHEFKPQWASHFLEINQEWIETYFTMEAFDWAQLSAPSSEILQKGGQIWFAEWEGQIVGTVAVKKDEEGNFELIKMGVKPDARGLGIGRSLGERAIIWAKSRGAVRLLLYSNTKLSSAIHLYRKLGFRETPIEPGRYARCDIKMEFVF